MTRYKTIIGRSEFIEFPGLLLSKIPAKTDTGAHGSSIHASNIKVVKKKGKEYLKFTLLDKHPSYQYSREVETPNFSRVTVSNSFGGLQERYAVNFKVKLAGKVFTTEFNLADRSVKVFPVLLGRKLLNKRFLVDSNITNIDRKTLKENLKLKLIEDDEPVGNYN